MGIPRLTTHLSSFFESTVVGCQGGCNEGDRREFTIDGPGLAYYIYHLLLSQSSAQSALDALPPYSLLAQTVVQFLDGLSRHHVELESIYFDGFLPKSKRPVRMERLESYMRQISNFHSAHSAGATVKRNTYQSTQSLTFEEMLAGRPGSRPAIRGLPAVPFLVPSIIEALRTSQYAHLVRLVPGEADVYCAQAAREKGCLVLTSDSDLLAYDLNPRGAVTFFDQVQNGTCEKCQKQAITARICDGPQICTRLGIDRLVDLAYQIKLDPYMTLHEAVRRAKASSNKKDKAEFRAFIQEYGGFDGSTGNTNSFSIKNSAWDTNCQLDPRLSELVIQVLQVIDERHLHIYLPVLIEDPTRASPWDIGREVRRLAYSLLFLDSSSNPPAFVEFARRGSTIRPLELNAMDRGFIVNFAGDVTTIISLLKERYGQMPGVSFWRSVSMHHILVWLLDAGKALPSNDAIMRILTNAFTREWQAWPDVHLLAQLEAFLYSLRMLKQILDHIGSRNSTIQELSTVMIELPSICELMPLRCRLDQQAFDISKIKASARASFAEVDDAKSDQDTGQNDDNATPVESWEEVRGNSKKKRKKAKGSGSTSKAQKIDPSNMFSLLPDS